MEKLLNWMRPRGIDYNWFCETPVTVYFLAAGADVPVSVVRQWIDDCEGLGE